MHTSIHSEAPKTPGIPARNGFTAYTYSPRRSGFVASVASRVNSADLTPASRRQDHTTSPSASVPLVRSTSTSTASHPASVTIAIRPCKWDETETDMPVIWLRMKAKIFLAMGIDRGDYTKSRPSGAGFLCAVYRAYPSLQGNYILYRTVSRALRASVSRIDLTKPRTFKVRAFLAWKRRKPDEQGTNSAVASQFWGWLHAATPPLARGW
jgi:hypothetical protein